MDSTFRFPDEILVNPVERPYEEWDGFDSLEQRWEITSSPHSKYLEELTGQTVYTDSNLKSLDSLGYAVCNNTLDCHGRKVYIHHNTRTFRENKERKNV